VSARRGGLRATIAAAPGTLRRLRVFLADLRRTTRPLGPAARNLSATAGPLHGVVHELDPFRHAAEPALAEALSLAPALSRLARGATPVVRASRPTTAALARFALTLPATSRALNGSVDNLLASIDNWSHAVQDRDGASHFFRGEASITPDLLRSALRLLAPTDGTARARDVKPTTGQPPARVLEAPRPSLPALADNVKAKLRELPGRVQQTVEGVVNQVHGTNGDHSGQPDAKRLLDFLLGP
jgi:phospholipid/cholesterol/gamma-HCH transport system substrate-binding protein